MTISTNFENNQSNYINISENYPTSDPILRYKEITEEAAFLRSKIDEKELISLKKLGLTKETVEKIIDKITQNGIETGTVDKEELKSAHQCLAKVLSREERLRTYPDMYSNFWRSNKAIELSNLNNLEAEDRINNLREEIRQLDQILDASTVKRAIKKIEGDKSVSISPTVEIKHFTPERGNYESLKLKVKKVKNISSVEEQCLMIKQLTEEISSLKASDNDVLPHYYQQLLTELTLLSEKRQLKHIG